MCVGGGGERDKETERATEREIERERDRERQRERQREIQRETETEREGRGGRRLRVSLNFVLKSFEILLVTVIVNKV